MNETEWLFYAIGAFAIGYGIAYLLKNMNNIFRQFGIFVIFLIPIVVVPLLFGAAIIADMQNIGLSIAFAAGFTIRLLKRS